MQDESVTYFYEGAFAHEGLLCRVDVLRKVDEGVVDLIEVKASNSVKADHIADAGFQLAVLEGAGLSCALCVAHALRSGLRPPRGRSVRAGGPVQYR